MHRTLFSLIVAAPVALLAVGATAALVRDQDDSEQAAIAYRQVGTASWYGPGFHGRETASGVVFDQNKLTAAHRELPLGVEVEVTNLDNGRKVTVLINDRGPYRKGRVLDVSKAAARKLGMVEEGLTKVRIEATPEQMAQAGQ